MRVPSGERAILEFFNACDRDRCASTIKALRAERRVLRYALRGCLAWMDEAEHNLNPDDSMLFAYYLAADAARRVLAGGPS